jgi:hypothetical protein
MDIDSTAIWTTISVYETTIISTKGRKWLQFHCHNPAVACNLLIELQDIINLFFDLGNNMKYREAFVRGDPIHSAPYMKVASIARGITNNFNNLVYCMSNSTYDKFPLCALSLPQLKKVARLASSTKPTPVPPHPVTTLL